MKLLVYLPTCSSKGQSSNVKSGPTRGKWLRQVQSPLIVCVYSVYVLETTSCRGKHSKTCNLSMKWKQKYSGWGKGESIMVCGQAEIRAYHICQANFSQLLFKWRLSTQNVNSQIVSCVHKSTTSALKDWMKHVRLLAEWKGRFRSVRGIDITLNMQ